MNIKQIGTILSILLCQSAFCQSLNDIATFKNSSWVEFKKDLNLSPLTIFQNHKYAFGFSVNDSIVLKAISHDSTGASHYKFCQKYKGLDVIGSAYSIHSHPNGSITGNGIILNNININTTPNSHSINAITVAEQEVLNLEATHYGLLVDTLILRYDSLYPTKADLVIAKLPAESWSSNNFKLVYLVQLKIVFPSDMQYFVFVEANTGDVLTTINGVFYSGTGTVNTIYNGGPRSIVTEWGGSVNKHRLIDNTRGNGIETRKKLPGSLVSDQFLNDNDNDWNDDYETQIHASTHWAAETVWDYFAAAPYYRNGSNGAGLGLRIKTNFNLPTAGSGFTISNESAVATNPFELTFRKEIPTKCLARVSLDDVGHEFFHGVGYTEANWSKVTLSDESSETYAIMEGYCDVFGELCENNVQGYVDWQYDAEAILDDQYLRTFSPPVIDGKSSIYYGDPYWTANTDGHFRGGVLRYFFYLISVGGNGVNHLGHNYCVEGIGIELAGKILYNVLTGYLDATSTFETLKNATVTVAANMFGENSNEVAQIKSAWFAVAVGPIYSGTLDYNIHTVSGTEGIHRNSEIIFNNLNIPTSTSLDVSSNVRITVNPSSYSHSGSYMHAYITPACEGSAKLDGSQNNNQQQNQHNLSQEPWFTLHPNPNTGHFTLTQTQEGYIKSYQLVNIMGQTLQKGNMQAGQTEKVIEISSLPKGIYILQLETIEGMKAERVVYQ